MQSPDALAADEFKRSVSLAHSPTRDATQFGCARSSDAPTLQECAVDARARAKTGLARFCLSSLRPIWQTLFKLYAVRANVKAGRNLYVGIGSKVWAPRQLVIGDDVHVGKLCTIECDGEIGDDVMIANAVGIIGRFDHDHTAVGVLMRDAPWIGDADYQGAGRDLRVVIGADVWIGYGAIILSGVTIGRGAIIGAGSVVMSDVRPYSIVLGNPARVVGTRFPPDVIARHEELIASRNDQEAARLAKRRRRYR